MRDSDWLKEIVTNVRLHHKKHEMIGRPSCDRGLQYIIDICYSVGFLRL